MKFYQCSKCKSIIHFINDTKESAICCGIEMEELIPNTNDASSEKHVPVIKHDSCNVLVEVGSVPHPMIENHYIEWIILETNKGYHKVNLKAGEGPCARFALVDGEEIVTAYAYCNIHGLWKSCQS